MISRKVGRPPSPRNLMTHKEIRELLVLKEWTREELAERLGLVRNTIDKWFLESENQRHPSEECTAKMRVWLNEERAKLRIDITPRIPSNGHSRKPAKV